MHATLVNAVAVLIGGGLGVSLGDRIPRAMRETVMQAVGLASLVIGVSMALGTRNVLLMILSLAVGAAIGEALRLESGLEAMGRWAEERLGARREGSTFVRGFMTGSLLFCVGPLTILGSIQAGLGQTPVLLYTKSLMDGVSSIAIGAGLGAGVILAGGTILVYQGALTLLASAVHTLMTAEVTREFTATGGVLVIGIGLTILRLQVIRVGNMLPALLIAPLLTALIPRLAPFVKSLWPFH
ncbi:MAG TPA: DUF554 domain-containing protein [bacterium]|nr:DUF554 domain-containing protein [bacterium]